MDQDAGGTVHTLGFLQRCVDLFRVSDIATQAEGSNLRCFVLHDFRPASEDRDFAALCRERLGGTEAHAGVASGHDRRLVLNVH